MCDDNTICTRRTREFSSVRQLFNADINLHIRAFLQRTCTYREHKADENRQNLENLRERRRIESNF